jgi:hypothetical protein
MNIIMMMVGIKTKGELYCNRKQDQRVTNPLVLETYYEVFRKHTICILYIIIYNISTGNLCHIVNI